jgi:DNA-binding transcriptional ArsR family regulator
MKNDVYSAFGNDVRVKLMLCLSKRPKNVTELINNCGLAQSAVSQHLSKLKGAGFVDYRKEGKEVYYRLKHKKITDIAELMVSLEKEMR